MKDAHVLIVEDSPTQAESLRYTLEQHGYPVSVARSGEDALACLSRSRPALVITDIVMPGMDGYELCGRVKADDRLKDIPVILLTSLSDARDVIRGLEAGANSFITKPYKEPHLLSRIRHVLLNREIGAHGRGRNEDIEILFGGRKYRVHSDRLQILELLLSTFESAVQKSQELEQANRDLVDAQMALKTANEALEERVKARTQDLLRSNAELEQIAYVSAHDLQEPLRMVSSYVQLLARRYKDRLDADAHTFIDYAVEGATRMQRLVNDLLSFTSVNMHGRASETVDCEAVFAEAVACLQPAIEGSRATVTHSPLPAVTADRAQLTQVFQRLIGNAVKFHSEEPPRIHVSAEEQGDTWVFSVRDNGIGIDPQYADRIFVMFQRLHRREEYPGNGIGLALCKKIVERHGGRIWMTSEPGMGATFHFTTPNPLTPFPAREGGR